MFKRGFCLFSILLLLCGLFSFQSSALSVPTLSASSACLMNADSGDVLFLKNADEKRGMASTTKLMTALLALEYGSPDKKGVVSAAAASAEGTSMGLRAEDTVTLHALIYGMLLQSGNDAAMAAAELMESSTERFVACMNQKASALGMKNTCFKNPSGLPQEGHYSTARDMAVLACAALKNPAFCVICGAKIAHVSFGTPECQHTFTNHNKLLWSYKGCIGLKTGFTKKDGRCLVTAAKRGGVTLVFVTLNDPDDWNDHVAMLDYGFSISEERTFAASLSEVKIPVVGSDCKEIGVSMQTQAVSARPKGSAEKYSVRIFRDPFLYAPVEKGAVVGHASFYDGSGKLLCDVLLTASADAKALPAHQKRKGPFEWLRSFFWGS